MHKHDSTPDAHQVGSCQPEPTLAVIPLIPPLILLIAYFEWAVFVLLPTLLNHHTAAYRPVIENLAFTAMGLVLNISALIAMRAKHWRYMSLFLLGSFLITIIF